MGDYPKFGHILTLLFDYNAVKITKSDLFWSTAVTYSF